LAQTAQLPSGLNCPGCALSGTSRALVPHVLRASRGRRAVRTSVPLPAIDESTRLKLRVEYTPQVAPVTVVLVALPPRGAKSPKPLPPVMVTSATFMLSEPMEFTLPVNVASLT